MPRLKPISLGVTRALLSIVVLSTLTGLVLANDFQPVLLLIDRQSISHGQPPNNFTTQDVNDELAAVGMRDNLPYFRRNKGQTFTLRAGQNQSPGWFALLGAPESWASAPGENDGLTNFVLAGPGLGSAEESGERTRLLRDAGIRRLVSANIEALRGRSICAVVYQGDLTPAATGADLTGKTLGLVAFKVLNLVSGSEGSLDVEVEILDTADTCQGQLSLPEPAASSQ